MPLSGSMVNPCSPMRSQHPSYEAVFNEAMSSYSSMGNALVLDALEPYDFSSISHLRDVGGGQPAKCTK